MWSWCQREATFFTDVSIYRPELILTNPRRFPDEGKENEWPERVKEVGFGRRSVGRELVSARGNFLHSDIKENLSIYRPRFILSNPHLIKNMDPAVKEKAISENSQDRHRPT